MGEQRPNTNMSGMGAPANGMKRRAVSLTKKQIVTVLNRNRTIAGPECGREVMSVLTCAAANEQHWGRCKVELEALHKCGLALGTVMNPVQQRKQLRKQLTNQMLYMAGQVHRQQGFKRTTLV